MALSKESIQLRTRNAVLERELAEMETKMPAGGANSDAMGLPKAKKRGFGATTMEKNTPKPKRSLHLKKIDCNKSNNKKKKKKKPRKRLKETQKKGNVRQRNGELKKNVWPPKKRAQRRGRAAAAEAAALRQRDEEIETMRQQQQAAAEAQRRQEEEAEALRIKQGWKHLRTFLLPLLKMKMQTSPFGPRTRMKEERIIITREGMNRRMRNPPGSINRRNQRMKRSMSRL